MEMLSVESASFKRHVIQRIVASTIPDFSALLGLVEDDPWPSIDEANLRLSAVRATIKSTENDLFLPFCEMLLADDCAYGVARQMHSLLLTLRRKETDCLSSLWKLKLSLKEMPTLLTMMPQVLLQALRAIEKPSRPDTWGMILLTQQHKIPCAVCKKHLQAEGSLRVRCFCCPFGYLVHAACVDKKKCLVCSTAYHTTKLQGH